MGIPRRMYHLLYTVPCLGFGLNSSFHVDVDSSPELFGTTLASIYHVSILSTDASISGAASRSGTDLACLYTKGCTSTRSFCVTGCLCYWIWYSSNMDDLG
jgi:hypothetical protein